MISAALGPNHAAERRRARRRSILAHDREDRRSKVGDTTGVPTAKRSTLLASVMIALSACGEPKPEPAAAPAPPQPAVATDAAAKAPARPITAPPPPPQAAKDKALARFDAAAAKAQATQFRDHLAAGRKAVKAKKFPEGIKALEAALTIDPNHASALAELGWALYLSGELAKAERATRQAITAATQDRTRGAALYNLGRIHEDRGEKDEAALAYQRSLTLRPNDTVSARLTALESAGAAPAAHECDVVAHSGRPPFDLCAAFIAKLPADPELFSESRCLEHETTTTEVAVDAAGTKYGGETATLITLDVGGGIQATSFGVERWLASGGAITERHLAVLFDEQWYTLALGEEYNPGVSYIGESFWVESMTAEDLVPGGRPELLLKMKWQHTDGDYGDNATEDTEHALVAVVSLDGAAPRWLGAFLNSAVDSTGPMLDDEPSEAPVTRTERAVDFRWLAASGELEIFARTGFEPSATPGRFTLGALPAACPKTLPYLR
jgi:tetratricopeptide (TPR) repeat protein